MTFLENRVYEYLCEKATNGRIIIKLKDLVSDLSETRGSTYNALKLLEKKRKIKKEGRGKIGMEIQILGNANNAISEDLSNYMNNEKSEGDKRFTKEIDLKKIRDFISNASFSDLVIIQDLVELNMIKRKKK